MCGLRTRLRTDVNPPRFLVPSNCHRRGANHRLAPSPIYTRYRPLGAISCVYRPVFITVYLLLLPIYFGEHRLFSYAIFRIDENLQVAMTEYAVFRSMPLTAFGRLESACRSTMSGDVGCTTRHMSAVNVVSALTAEVAAMRAVATFTVVIQWVRLHPARLRASCERSLRRSNARLASRRTYASSLRHRAMIAGHAAAWAVAADDDTILYHLATHGSSNLLVVSTKQQNV